jgi:DNA-binding transcriptional MerR regulator
MEVDELAARFVALAKKPNLSKAELAEAQRLMRELKKAGMSNEEISKLSGRRWSASSVKGYVPGVRAADPSPWGDAVSTLNEAINRGISLDDVQTAVRLQDQLAAEGVTLEEVATLLAAAKSAGVGVEPMIQQHQELQVENLSVNDIGQALDLKRQLEEQGLSLQSLPQLIKLARSFGDADAVLEAVSKYGSMKELDEELVKGEGRLKRVRNELGSETKSLEETTAELKKLKAPLEAYGNVVKVGFSEAELKELASLTKKYGGIRRVFEAIKGHGDYADICNAISRGETTLSQMKGDISKTEEQHAHLKASIGMCDRLLHNYKFGLDAIATIFSLAQKFGDPLSVLKAVEAYGELLAIQQEYAKAEAKCKEKKDLLDQLEGKYGAMLTELESLTAMCLNVGKNISVLQSQIDSNKGLEKIFNLISEPTSCGFNEYGPLVAAILSSIRKWLVAHEQKFKHPAGAKFSLDGLLRELGAA